MHHPPAGLCPRCGSPAGEGGVCMKCLLDSGIAGAGQSLAERIFQAALSLGADERAAFVASAASGDAAVLGEVQMLLQGYEEAGGDAAQATLGGTAHERWAGVRREEPGTVIDHFRLVKIIGEGGMGSVWEAEQTEPIKRRVALKIIKLGMDTEEVVRRFERERRTLARMTHPHIAQVYEAGATPAGRPYFAMELVEGTAITTHCLEQRLPVRERLALFLHVCAAVEHAHQKGVIHRDLKPSNILVAGGAVKVIDFGVAKATQDDGGDGLLTKQAQVLGTPAYMSPEQAESNGTDVDTRTDVYSLGAVLYELLSGALPFDPKRLSSTHLREVQRILREEMPPRPSTRITPGRYNPPLAVNWLELKGDLDWITMKALSKERERRYPSAAAFAEDVRRFLHGEPVSAVPPTLAYRAGKFVRRHKAGVAAAAAVLLALSGGLVVSLDQVRRANAALAGEAKARALATFTVADMHTSSGLTAAENGDPSRAALWFARAAVIGAADPDRTAANRLRAEAWRMNAMPAVTAFPSLGTYLKGLSWNPRLPWLLTIVDGDSTVEIRHTESGARWADPAPWMDAVWSPRGDQLAVFLKSGELALIDFPSGREVQRWPMTGWNRPAWSLDGQWLAAGGHLVAMETLTSRPLPPGVGQVSFSRNSRLLLMQPEHGAVQLTVCRLEAPDRPLFAPVNSAVPISAFFLDPDGRQFALTEANGDLVIRDSATGAETARHPGQTGQALSSLQDITPDGRLLARLNCATLDLATGQPLAFPASRALGSAMRFSRDGTRFASGGYDNRVELWDVAAQRFLGVVGHHHHAVLRLEFSPDGHQLATSEHGVVRIWRLPAPEPVKRLDTGAPSLAVLSPDGQTIAAAGFTRSSVAVRKTRTWNVATGEPAGPEISPGGLLMDAVFAGENLWLAVSTSGSRDQAVMEKGGCGQVELWNPRTATRIGEPILLPSEPRGLSLHPGGHCLGVICGGGEGVEIDLPARTVRVLFRNAFPIIPQATLNNGRCRYSPDGRIFATWGSFKYMHLWDRAAARDLIEPFREDTTVFDLDFHGDTVVRTTVGPQMTLDFFHAATGQPAAASIPYTNWPFLSRFSADGTLLLSAGGAGAAQVWDWRAGKMICPALLHDDGVMAGCFVPGTPWVITGGHDRKIKFWDRRTGLMIRPPLERPGWVLGLEVTPDARTLIATGFLNDQIELHDLTALLPAPALSPAALQLRAEIDADAEIHPGGGLAPLTPQAWMEKWNALQAAERMAGDSSPVLKRE